MDTESYDWAHDAFVALNPSDLDVNGSSDKWPSYTTLRPSMPTASSIERHGQITPPEDFSPLGPDPERRDSLIPSHVKAAAQLSTEQPGSVERQLQALYDFQPQQSHASSQPSPDRAPKRRRTTKQASVNVTQAPYDNHPAPQSTASNAQPPKRKRGRPKSQPQPQSIESYSQDGFPFPVSTARQSHLEKNRVAAHKCRQRRKEYIDGLEARGREASSKNKILKESVAILREEVLELKNEVLRHAGCNFWAVDEYLARCAGDLLGMDGPHLNQRKHELVFSPPNKTDDDVCGKEDREPSQTSPDTLPSQASPDSPPDFDDYFLDSLDE